MSWLARKAGFARRLRGLPLLRVLAVVGAACLARAAWVGWVETERAVASGSGFAASFPVYRHAGVWVAEQVSDDDGRGTMHGEMSWTSHGRYTVYKKSITVKMPRLERWPADVTGQPEPSTDELMTLWRSAVAKQMNMPGPEWMAAAAPGRTVVFGFDGRAKMREFAAQTAATGAPFSLTVLAGAAMVAVVGLRRLTRGWVREAGECLRCGYDLRAAPGAVCPECGAGREG